MGFGGSDGGLVSLASEKEGVDKARVFSGGFWPRTKYSKSNFSCITVVLI